MTSTAYPAADLDRRLSAYAVDRLASWGIAAGIGYLVGRSAGVWPGVLTAVGVVLLLGLVLGVLSGVTGTTPGMSLTGIRLVGETGHGPIGVGPGVLRAVVLGVAGLPTLCLGVATCAWTAAMDPTGRRRGLHDRLAHSMVVDARVAPAVEPVVEPAAPQIVNLTAMRLAPAPAADATPAGPVPAPVAAVPGPPAPAPPAGPPPAGPPPPPPSLGRPVAPAPASADPDGSPLTPSTVMRPPAPGDRPASRWHVEFDTGESFEVEGMVLVGRRPEPRVGEQVWRAVSLRSDDMSVSKTHGQFQVTPAGTLVVMDRGSTNGTFVIRQGLSKATSPGRPSTLLDGDLVRFGDRTMTVTRLAPATAP